MKYANPMASRKERQIILIPFEIREEKENKEANDKALEIQRQQAINAQAQEAARQKQQRQQAIEAQAQQAEYQRALFGSTTATK